MTYLEKYMQEHPYSNRDIIICGRCPDDIHTCDTLITNDAECTKCWNQEIPETEKTEEPKKYIGLSYEEKQKLLRFVLELSDEERDHLLDYINALDELAHKQEMADNICERFLNCERKDV